MAGAVVSGTVVVASVCAPEAAPAVCDPAALGAPVPACAGCPGAGVPVGGTDVTDGAAPPGSAGWLDTPGGGGVTLSVGDASGRRSASIFSFSFSSPVRYSAPIKLSSISAFHLLSGLEPVS